MTEKKEEPWIEEIRELRSKARHPTAFPYGYELRPPLQGSILYCSICAKPISDGVISNLMDLIKEVQVHERINHADRK